jgi:inosine-uridine nucleoside N-ribohydrolase
MRRKILIDTDPGIDDAMAILMALGASSLEVIGLTTVYGNHQVGVTTTNALSILEWVDRGDVPVAQGAAAPLFRPRRRTPVEVHGEDGLGNVFLPAPKGRPIATQAADFIVEQIMAQPGEITLVAVGPLTNLALALQKEPQLSTAVKEVVIMGGAVESPGNVTALAEANIHADPEAAAIVFAADWPVTLVGLDVTTRAILSDDHLQQIVKVGNPAGILMGRIFPLYQQFHRDFYELNGETHTHDPAAVAWLLDPTLFGTERCHLRVETGGEADGRTVWDRQMMQTRPICSVCVDVDVPRLLQLIQECLAAL